MNAENEKMVHQITETLELCFAEDQEEEEDASRHECVGILG